MIHHKKFLVAAAAATLIGGAGLSAATASPAAAQVCGYNKQLRDIGDTPINIGIGPLSFTVGGGQQQVGVYGNCSSDTQLLEVTDKDGEKGTRCFTPDSETVIAEWKDVSDTAFLGANCK